MALILDTIAQAHNRLQAAGSPMFSLAVPIRAITWGDTTAATFEQPVSTGWEALTPTVRHPKKPGHGSADYRVQIQVPTGTSVALQVGTRRAPFNPSRRIGDPGVVEVTGSTSTWQTISIAGVPVDRGTEEECSLFIRSTIVGTSAATTTYGSPATGELPPLILRSRGLLLDGAGATPMAWSTTQGNQPDDYGTRGYLLQIADPDGVIVAHYTLETVFVVNGDFTQDVALREDIARSFGQAIAAADPTDPFTWKLIEPGRALFAGIAGATADRSP